MRDGKLGNVAQSDLRRVSRAAVKSTKAREELRQAITLARASGETLQDIGAAAGVSAERIRQIVSEKWQRLSLHEGCQTASFRPARAL
jgi:DNA-directed RNA polymerase sigma subunit (sigma70/sigma32)